MHPVLQESCDEEMACAQIEFDEKQTKESSNGQHEAMAVGMRDRPEGSEANHGELHDLGQGENAKRLWRYHQEQ